MASISEDQVRPFYKGANRTFTATFTSKDLITTANPEGRVDLTLATVYYTWKKFPGDNNPAKLALLTGTGITHLTQSGATLGQATITILFSDIAALETGPYHRDVWAVLTGDDRKIALTPAEVSLEPAVLAL
jgi:hypothetical protein